MVSGGATGAIHPHSITMYDDASLIYSSAFSPVILFNGMLNYLGRGRDGAMNG